MKIDEILKEIAPDILKKLEELRVRLLKRETNKKAKEDKNELATK